MWPEEAHARELHADLQHKLVSDQVSIAGSGVHWHCETRSGERSCQIHCFDYPGSGAEYYLLLKNQAQTVSTGRTSSKSDAIYAVATWLDGLSLRELHARFTFIDKNKRSLTAIEEGLIGHCPELGHSASHQLQVSVGDHYELHFGARDRACRLLYYGQELSPRGNFDWDGCRLFEIRTSEVPVLAVVLKRWICDRAMPSAMRAEFPWIEMSPLADYCEQGRPIEGEFIESWARIRRFYEYMVKDNAVYGQVLQFVEQIRGAGYEAILRAGQSMDQLILSRSRRHGLRNEQPHIGFSWHANGRMNAYVKLDSTEKLLFGSIRFTPEIDTLLRRLALRPID